MSTKITRRSCKKSNDTLTTYKTSIEYFEEILFKKNKFKFSNNFDEKNSETLLSDKNYYLQEICLDDKIDAKNAKINKKFKNNLSSSNNKLKYYIVVTDYDENKKKNKKQKNNDNVNIYETKK